MKLYHLRLIAAGAFLAVAPTANADTLADTLVKAYQLSPLLEANRAALRSIDENVAQARSGKRPQISASSTARYQFANEATIQGAPGTHGTRTDTYRAQLSLDLNIIDGGNTKSAIESAKASVLAGRAQLKDVEQTVLLQAVTAYMDVRRDTEFVSLSQNNVRVLQQQVRAATDRFELGDITRTDVSVATARFAAAKSSLAAAHGRLNASRENFLAVVGVPAHNLQSPPALPKLPQSLSDAEAIAMREHPGLNAARHQVTGAEWDHQRARSAIKPRVDVGANVFVNRVEQPFARTPTNIGRRHNTSTGADVNVTASIPLYKGGLNASLIRQSNTLVSQRKYELQSAARQVRQEVAFSWSDRNVARATIVSNRQQVEAAQIAFNGVRDEANLGSRTTLDVLDREQELRDAQVQLAASRRDEYVAAYNILAAMGLLTVQHLNLGIPVYDVHEHYKRVEKAPVNRLFGRKLDRIKGRYSN